MKIDELVVGEEYVTTQYPYGSRVRVEEIVRRPEGGWGRREVRMARCIHLDPATGEPQKAGHPDALQDSEGNQMGYYPARILESWASYEEDQRYRLAREQRQADYIAKASNAFDGTGLDARVGWGMSRCDADGDVVETIHIQIPTTQLDLLTELLQGAKVG